MIVHGIYQDDETHARQEYDVYSHIDIKQYNDVVKLLKNGNNKEYIGGSYKVYKKEVHDTFYIKYFDDKFMYVYVTSYAVCIYIYP